MITEICVDTFVMLKIFVALQELVFKVHIFFEECADKNVVIKHISTTLHLKY